MTTSGDCGVCGKPGRGCARCMTVFYCSLKHQAADWARHRPNCTSPFVLVENKSSKRPHLVATRTIEKGTQIMISSPIVTGPSGLRSACLGCLRPSVYDVMSYQCEGCGWPVCNYDCQRSSIHQAECLAMQKARYRLPKEIMRDVVFWRTQFPFIGQWLLLLRCLLLPANKLAKLKKIKTVMNIPMKSDLTSIFLPAITFIRNSLQLTQFNEAEIAQVGFLLLNGGVQIHVESLEDAFLLEPRAAVGVHVSDVIYLEHSCHPNMSYVETMQDPKTIHVVAQRTIYAGEILTALKQSYCSAPLSSTLHRQKIAALLSLPPCSCKRCLDPTELGFYIGSIKCQKCQGNSGEISMIVPKCPSNIIASDWICENCGFVTSASNYQLIIGDLASKLSKAQSKQGDLKELIDFIENNSGSHGVLHPNHELIIVAKDEFCNVCIENISEKGAAFSICSEVLARFSLYNSDLCDILHKISNIDYHLIHFRAKKVSCTSIMRDWIQEKISKRRAIELLLAEYGQIMLIPNSLNMGKNFQLMIANFMSELVGYMKRLGEQYVPLIPLRLQE